MHHHDVHIRQMLQSDQARHSVDGDEFPRELMLELRDGDTAWHPASTRATVRVIEGPGIVRYLLHVDGGIDARLF